MNCLKLKALPVAMALAALCGAAQAQTTVTLYGDINGGILESNYKATGQTPVLGVNTAVTGGSQLFDDSSLWGMKGREDLGGGNYAGFSLEGGLNFYNGTMGQDGPTAGRIFGRDAEAKFGGTWGEIYAGYVLSPAGLQLLLAADPWYWNGNAAGMGWAIQQANYTETNYLRTTSTVGYRSPNIGGLTFQASYSFNQPGNLYGTSPDFGFEATYKQGGLTVGAGYDQSHSDANDPTMDHMWDIVGGYDFGVIHPSFSYTKSSINNVTYNAYVIAATAPVTSASFIKAAYGHLSNCQPSGCPVDTGAYTRGSLGYQYNLSKQTNVFANVSQSKVAGLSSINSLELGMEHSF